ncbi:hypothetical protein ASPFODRAFT_212672 [Aspergillus luchuensis CBS 106.47]|uniref:Uncharacterized protein n=1 Tax=Aspergillus luchuensis (strain CBS 106.47) TaxID=1137211 RepID=A0A1M3T112_ASPLC|nr:hypothetical protein ASPFODRAFT_212672 [Aspergillus luchuensis CBS 106.47]
MLADDSKEDSAQGQAFALLSRPNGWKSNMWEQKQWNQNIEETVERIKWSPVGSGTKVLQRAARIPAPDTKNIRRRWRDG